MFTGLFIIIGGSANEVIISLSIVYLYRAKRKQHEDLF